MRWRQPAQARLILRASARRISTWSFTGKRQKRRHAGSSELLINPIRPGCRWGSRGRQPFWKTLPGLAGTERVARAATAIEEGNLRWWSRSVDSTYLTGKRCFVFGEANLAVGAARGAAEELGFEIVGLGAYNREFARDVRTAATQYGVDPLITDDYLEIEARIADVRPELILGTQMERHIGKRLGIPAAVISAPAHVQDFPARYSPQLGFEGANVLFDSWVHPLVMGLEEHLLHMFRNDFEFNDAVGPSHLSGHGARAPQQAESAPAPHETTPAALAFPAGEPALSWAQDAEIELKKIPFFVRGKARRNVESFAKENNIGVISVDTLYEAKAHYGR